MGNSNVPVSGDDQERTRAVDELTEALKNLRGLQQVSVKDDAWLTRVISNWSVVEAYERDIDAKVLVLFDGGDRSTRITSMIAEAHSVKEALKDKIAELSKARHTARLKKTIEILCPGLLVWVDDYESCVPGTKVDLELVARCVANAPGAEEAWQRKGVAESAKHAGISAMGDDRMRARTAWHQLSDQVGKNSQKIKDEVLKAQTQEGLKAAQAESRRLLTVVGWDDEAKAQLDTAVSVFQRLISGGWSITPQQVEHFYKEAGKSDPGDVLTRHSGIAAVEPAFSLKRYKIPFATGHAPRIRTFIQERVDPAAREAGLYVGGDAVVHLVQAVATAWCSLVSDSDTGGSPTIVANFTRGDLISTIRDLPDETAARKLSDQEKIQSLRDAISRENLLSRRTKLQETLNGLLASQK